MANYEAVWRSNYIAVKDEAAFTKEIEDSGLKDHLDVARDDTGERICLCGTGGEGIPLETYNEESDDWGSFDWGDFCSRHLKEGEVLIVMEAGCEKLRYITGISRAYNHEGATLSVSIDDIYGLVEKHWGTNPTECAY
jgi:hypothetical protein